MSYQTLIESGVGAGTHHIKLVPVESLQKGESDVESVSSSSEDDIQEVHEVITTSNVNLEVGGSASEGNQIRCLFCYNKVGRYVINKPYHRRILNNTCQRLFKYVCDHLDMDFKAHAGNRGRGREKTPKEGQLLPPYLPLCGRCKEMYYNNIYESFVTYEQAVSKLSDQIAACITRTIGLSAKRDSASVQEQAPVNPTEDIFDAYEKAMSEHPVMRAVRQFRKKVVEKNPAGYIEDNSGSAPTPRRLKGRVNVVVEQMGEAAPTVTPVDQNTNTLQVGPNLKNVIKIVKNRTDFHTNNPERSLEEVKLEMYERNEGIEVTHAKINTKSKSDLDYYAVSNPAPGVIQIIPVVVGENGEAVPNIPLKTKQKRRRSQREDYQQQRIALNTCKFCNKYFPGQIQLIRHQVLKHGMEKPEKCPQCDYRGMNKASLKSHMETHLDGEDKEKAKKFACEICGLKMRSKSGLQAHIRGHNGERPFICDVCGKSFTSNTSRQLCLDKHNGIKNHKCRFCDKTFLRKEVLKIHERTHTGEKPFACHLCEKSFAQRSPLNIHLKMHKRKDPSCVIKKKKT